jgi:hypothetical protein
MSTNAPNPTPGSQFEPQALSLLVQYDAQAHGAARAFYSALKDEINRMYRAAGGSGVRLGLASADTDAGGAPTGRISIPVTPLNPDDPARAMNDLAKALLADRARLPGVISITRAA